MGIGYPQLACKDLVGNVASCMNILGFWSRVMCASVCKHLSPTWVLVRASLIFISATVFTTLGRCLLSIFCSRGTPLREVPPSRRTDKVSNRLRALTQQVTSHYKTGYEPLEHRSSVRALPTGNQSLAHPQPSRVTPPPTETRTLVLLGTGRTSGPSGYLARAEAPKRLLRVKDKPAQGL